MILFAKSLPILLLLVVVACARPSTITPKVTEKEILQEKALQHEATIRNPFPPIVEPVSRTKKMKKRLQKIANKVSPEATRLCRKIHNNNINNNCSFALSISKTPGVNAYATGNSVVIHSAMMEFAKDDTHLALVLAHELAHNIMDHVKNTRSNATIGAVVGSVFDNLAKTQGVNSYGGFSEAGANVGVLKYSSDFEKEADYIGLYILARAGYDIKKAPDFWRAMSQYDPSGVYMKSTHPTNPERYVTLKKTIAEIYNKKHSKQPLIPNFIQQTARK